eukprot:6005482-Karenia_brevis.AAC.1
MMNVVTMHLFYAIECWSQRAKCQSWIEKSVRLKPKVCTFDSVLVSEGPSKRIPENAAHMA